MASAPSPVSVAIGVFEDLVSLGLHELVKSDPSLELVGRSIRTDQLQAVLARSKPAVLLIDWDLLPRPGLVDELRRDHPDTRVLVLVGSGSDTSCTDALGHGAAGCLGKDAQRRDIINAIHLASRGLRLLPDSPETFSSRQHAPDGSSLTPREVEVLRALQEGYTNAQVAGRLAISLETVRTHSRNIYRKLGVRSRGELGRARVRGLPPVSDQSAPSPARDAAAPPASGGS